LHNVGAKGFNATFQVPPRGKIEQAPEGKLDRLEARLTQSLCSRFILADDNTLVKSRAMQGGDQVDKKRFGAANFGSRHDL
jgi:hypothetical protein